MSWILLDMLIADRSWPAIINSDHLTFGIFYALDWNSIHTLKQFCCCVVFFCFRHFLSTCDFYAYFYAYFYFDVKQPYLTITDKKKRLKWCKSVKVVRQSVGVMLSFLTSQISESNFVQLKIRRTVEGLIGFPIMVSIWKVPLLNGNFPFLSKSSEIRLFWRSDVTCGLSDLGLSLTEPERSKFLRVVRTHSSDTPSILAIFVYVFVLSFERPIIWHFVS